MVRREPLGDTMWLFAAAMARAAELDVPELFVGEEIVLTVTGAEPGANVVFFASSRAGAGPCPAVLGGQCMGIKTPRKIGQQLADAAGVAAVDFEPPAGLAGSTVHLQGIAVGQAVSLTAVVSDDIDIDGGGGHEPELDEIGVVGVDDGWRPPDAVLLEGVLWLPQAEPPGDWPCTMTSGPTSLVMVADFFGALLDPLGSDAILAVSDWMDDHVAGYDLPAEDPLTTWIDAECGDSSTTLMLEQTLLEYYGLSATRFVDGALADVYDALVAGELVIVSGLTQSGIHAPADEMVLGGAGQFFVVVGLTPTHIVLHDPGRGNPQQGEGRSWTIDSFLAAWQANSGVVVRPDLPPPNQPPSAPIITVLPDPFRSDEILSVSILEPSVDPDGDIVTYDVEWRLDGVVREVGLVLDASLTTRGELWEVVVVPTDGIIAGPAATQTFTIENALPVVSDIALQPPTPQLRELVTCSYSFFDGDLDPDQSTVRWLSDEVVVGSGPSYTVVDPHVDLVCEVTPNDGLESGAPARISVPQIPMNILVVLMDDVGVDQFGVYGIGPEVAQTPRIDALAAEGILFRHAYSQPVCTPTRGTIQTGRHGYRTGLLIALQAEDDYALSHDEVTIPEMLDAGTGGEYAHSYVGKWHMGTLLDSYLDHPNVHGYDFYAGAPIGPAGCDDCVYTTDGLPQSYFDWERVENGVVARETQYIDSNNVDTALERIEAMPEPWFLMIALSGAHAPFHTPPADLFGGPAVGATEEEEMYHWAIEATDTEIGRLLDSVDPAVLARTTLLLASDNGTPKDVVSSVFNPNRQKRTLYEGGIHVAMIVNGPLVVDPGREVDALVATTDLFPTIAGIAGASLDPTVEIDGTSMMPYLLDPAAPPQRTHVYAELASDLGFGPFDFHDKMIRTDQYKLVRFGNRDELYDLTGLDVEGTNLLADGASAEESAIVAELEALLPL